VEEWKGGGDMGGRVSDGASLLACPCLRFGNEGTAATASSEHTRGLLDYFSADNRFIYDGELEMIGKSETKSSYRFRFKTKKLQ
jgi:hypothetical protein